MARQAHQTRGRQQARRRRERGYTERGYAERGEGLTQSGSYGHPIRHVDKREGEETWWKERAYTVDREREREREREEKRGERGRCTHCNSIC
jgi:hypothetical protein